MEGGSCSSSSLLGLGENNSNGICPMFMMPLITTSNHSATQSSSPLFPFHHSTRDIYGPGASSAAVAGSSLDNNNHRSSGGGGCFYMGGGSYCHTEGGNNTTSSSSSSSLKTKVMSHPHFYRLLAAYANCQKVGAPPEVVAKLEEACASQATLGTAGGGGCIGDDPALDQFMEAYCEMLTKYEQELTKPFKEAMHFLSQVECQFKALTVASSESMGRNVSSEEEDDVNNSLVDPQAEDRELKVQLLRKYSGYLGSLKQEFMKKRKKGKLPKEARQQLLDWWSRHYKWPYPSESQKLALAESTGLDQKQINNWFINQRKRHWKPSEDMQFMVMDAAQPHYCMDTLMGNPFSMDISPLL